MQRLVKGVTVLAGGLVLVSFGGALHPAGDSFAVFRLPLLVVFALGAIWSDWPRRLRWPLAGLALASMVQIVWLKLETPEPGRFTVYQKNLWFGNESIEALVDDIRRMAPDVVALHEVSPANAAILSELSDLYPHQHRCRYESDVGNAVLSRLPATGAAFCSERRGLAGLRIEAESGPVWVVSVHLFWPWPFDQPDQIAPYVRRFEALEGPVVLAGDFNMVPWGASVRQLASAARVRLAGPMRPTFFLPNRDSFLRIPLPIDHVFAPGGGAVERRPLLGSGHHGLFARVRLAP